MQNLVRFLKEVRGELSKVVWPSNKELLNYSGVVGLAVLIVCILIWACDSVFAKMFHLILS